MNIIEKLKKEKTKWENRIYGVGETRIDLMIEDVIRELQKYQAELEKKDKVINEMATYIDQLTNELVSETGDNNLKCCESKECLDNGDLECKDCIIKFYTNKVEREGK